MVKKYYTAYGSNLNVRQMMERCPNAEIVGTSEIPNYELLFKGSKTGSYLTIEPQVGSIVPVAVWNIGATDEVSLDRYEGFPTFYYKTEMELSIKDIKSRKIKNRTTFVYIMHEDRSFGIPSRYYVETCLEGYQNFGFDKNILFQALKNSRRNYYEGK